MVLQKTCRELASLYVRVQRVQRAIIGPELVLVVKSELNLQRELAEQQAKDIIDHEEEDRGEKDVAALQKAVQGASVLIQNHERC